MRRIQQIIPPPHNAVRDIKNRPHMTERGIAINTIEAEGREAWKKQKAYHHRSKAETVMFRYKCIVGDKLAARKFAQQKTEASIGCKILKVMLQLTKPESVKIIA